MAKASFCTLKSIMVNGEKNMVPIAKYGSSLSSFDSGSQAIRIIYYKLIICFQRGI